MKYIDLHTHSYYSDGSFSPTDLVLEAKKANLSAIALTDHDNVDGVREAILAGQKYGIEVISGIEFSVKNDVGETHILGYGIYTDNPILTEAIEKSKESRRQNNVRTAQALQNLGIDITVEDARAISPKGLLGRAHFAKVMVNKGYVKSVKEAFDKYLQKGRPGYNSLRLFDAEETINIIHASGGKAFLAHLHLTKLKGNDLDEYVKELKSMGLDGIEGYYTEYDEKMEREYHSLAKKYSLLVSGGSDYHGSNKTDIKIGVGYGNLKIPYGLLEKIKNKK